jgi:hypothetical protein
MTLKLYVKVAVMTLETTLHTKFTDTPEMWDAVDLSKKNSSACGSARSQNYPRCRRDNTTLPCCHEVLSYFCSTGGSRVAAQLPQVGRALGLLCQGISPNGLWMSNPDMRAE